MKLAAFYLLCVFAQYWTSRTAHTQTDDISVNLTFTFIFIHVDLILTCIKTNDRGAWVQIRAPAVPLATSDTRAGITTFTLATSPWLLWVRRHDTKNFSSPMKSVSVYTEGKQGREETSGSFSLAPLVPVRVSQRNPGWKAWRGAGAFRFGAVRGSGRWLIKAFR